MKKPMKRVFAEEVVPRPPKQKRERIPPSAAMIIPRGTSGGRKKSS